MAEKLSGKVKRANVKRQKNSFDKKQSKMSTLQNKVRKLAKLVRDNPNDISADIALSQARYDLRVGNY